MAVALILLLGVAFVLLVPFIIRIIKEFRKVRRIVHLTRDIPGPRLWPVVGCLTDFLAAVRDMHGTINDMVRKYGSMVRLQVFGRVVIMVMDPDDVQVVCTHPGLSKKAERYDQLREHLGMGLVTMSGPAYKRHRKAITPSLHLDILQDFVPTFAKNAETMALRLQQHADDGTPLDMSPEFGMLANMTITETVLSMRRDGVSDKEYVSMVDVLSRTSEIIMWRVMRPWWNNDFVFRWLSSRAETYRKTADGMNSMVTDVLQFKLDEVSRGVAPPPRRRMAFLDHVLRSAESANMSEEELRDELKTFLFAGSTTSMDFLSLVVLMFSMFPDVQRKVQQELDDIFGPLDAHRPVTAEDLGHMHYTECVLKETMRYAPPVPLMFREATEDVKLASGVVVPRGCLVALVPAGTHRQEKHFPDPLRFDPDRFLPENTRGRHPFAFIPFSAGTRNCIGQRYAIMLAKTAVATLLRRYTFLPAPGGPRGFHEVNVDLGITIAVRGGANVRVQSRLAAAK